MAGGNMCFVSDKFWMRIEKSKVVKASPKEELFSLAVCCFMILGDKNKKFYESMSAETPEFDFKSRDTLMMSENY